MAPEQDLQTRIEPSATPAATEAPRPRRGSGRGHRGRGRHHRPRAPRKEGSVPTEAAAAVLPHGPTTEPEVREQMPVPGEGSGPVGDSSSSPVAPHPRGQSIPKRSIEDAIDQVNQIITALKESLEQMDEVLELLEHFERQGDADEREIESLRRALRQLQRPREGGHHPHRGQS